MKKLFKILYNKTAIEKFITIQFFVWFAGFICTIKAQEDKLRFSYLTIENGLSQNTIHGITKDKFGYMWFGTWEGANRYDGYTIKIFRANEKDTFSLSNNRINNICLDSFQNIWILTGDQIYCRYNYESDNFTRFSQKQVPGYIITQLNSTPIKTVITPNKQYRWKIENNDLVQINLNNGKQIRYKKDPFNERLLNDYKLIQLYIDNTGILWIGTENGGINYADTYLQPFEHYKHSVISEYSLVSDVVRAICEDLSGNIWVGTQDKGITIIHPNSSFSHLQRLGDNSRSIISNEIRSLYCDHSGIIWIGTKDGLAKYNFQTKQFLNYSVKSKHSIPDNWVFSITEDHTKTIWIGTFNGIAKYNPQLDSFVCFNSELILKSKKIRRINEDHHHNLWIATEGGGLTVLKRDTSDKNSERLIPIKHFVWSAKDKKPFPSNTVLAIEEDENENLWIGTNNGLCLINTNTLQLKNLDILGFPDKLIMGIISDKRGYVWISHKKGITKININNLSIRNYNKSDGLQGTEFTQNACYRSLITKKLYFGGINGLNAFYPDKIIINPHYPKVYITSILINNQQVEINKKFNNRIVLKKALHLTPKIELLAQENNLAIEFTALHYTNPPENKYLYILEGFDKTWQNTNGLQRKVIYSNLPSGIYTFKVKAANCDDVWNPSPANLTIIIYPHWWRTKWAISTYLISFISLILYLFFRYKSKKNLNTITNSHTEDKIFDIAPPSHKYEDPFIKKAIVIIKENISNTEFGTEELSKKLSISQRQLYRKIRTSTNLTVHDFITDIRMQEAKELLISGNLTIAEIAYKVGYSEPANFTRTFTKKMGTNPSGFLKDLKNVH